jgi:hypothetical protein
MSAYGIVPEVLIGSSEPIINGLARCSAEDARLVPGTALRIRDEAAGETQQGSPDGVDSDQPIREPEDFLRKQREARRRAEATGARSRSSA